MISKDSSSPRQDSFSSRAPIPPAEARLIHEQELSDIHWAVTMTPDSISGAVC